jgi:hypothetical protein
MDFLKIDQAEEQFGSSTVHSHNPRFEATDPLEAADFLKSTLPS